MLLMGQSSSTSIIVTACRARVLGFQHVVKIYTLIVAGNDAGSFERYGEATEWCSHQLCDILHHWISTRHLARHCGWNGCTGNVEWTTRILNSTGQLTASGVCSVYPHSIMYVDGDLPWFGANTELAEGS